MSKLSPIRRIKVGIGLLFLLLLVVMVPNLGAKPTASARLAQNFDITARVTVDNNYCFGWGTVNSISQINFWGENSAQTPGRSCIRNTSAGDIYNCPGANPPANTPIPGAEYYPNLNPTIIDYLYIIAWSDNSDLQGVLGEFHDNISNTTIRSGDPNWQVFATGIDYGNTGPPPLLTQINQQIGLANTNGGQSATSSVGWVGTTTPGGDVGTLKVGPDNLTGLGPNHVKVCNLDQTAGTDKWMWYSDTTTPPFDNPFQYVQDPTNHWREFQIYRLPVKAFAPENPCCDTLTEQPFDYSNLQESGRTFTITNHMASPICSIDVTFVPSTPASYSGGGPGAFGGILVDGTNYTNYFHFPYIFPPTSIPYPPPANRVLSPGATNTVVFNLGVNWTLNPTWAGTVHIVVHHCDGTTCTLDSKPWIAKQPGGGPGWQPAPIAVEPTHNIHFESFDGGRLGRTVSYTSFSTVDPKDHLLADAGVAAGQPTRGAGGSIVVVPNGLRSNSVIYQITRTPKGGIGHLTVQIAVRRATGKKGPSVLRWITYDANSNPISTGKVRLG